MRSLTETERLLCALIRSSLLLGMILIVPPAFSQPQLSVSRDTVDFGPLQTGVTRLDSFAIANTGDSTLTVNSFSLSGDSGFSLSFSATPFPIAAGQSASVYVELKPENEGGHLARVGIQTDRGESFVVLIGGMGVPQMQIDRDTIDFGPLRTGWLRIDSFIVTNTGGSSLVVNSLSISGDPVFSLSSAATPFSIPAGQKSTVRVQFEPQDENVHVAVARVVTDRGIDSVVLIGGEEVQYVDGLDSIYRIRFSPIEVETIGSEVLEIFNRGAVAVVQEIMTGSPDAVEFEFPSEFTEGFRIDNDPIPLRFYYTPSTSGRHVALYECRTDRGIFLLELQGEAFLPDAGPGGSYPFRLDTAVGKVGDRITTRLIADSVPTKFDAGDVIELTLIYNPQSLWLEDVRSLREDLTAALTPVAEGEAKVMIEGFAGGGDEDPGEWLELVWVGLSTGVPKNIVEGDLSVRTQKGFFSRNLSGLVLLEGCTLGAGTFGRRVTLSSVGIDPSGGRLLIEYAAPEGVPGRLEIIDMLGAGRRMQRLQGGTGAGERLEISIDDLPRGLYGLRVEFADDVLLVPFVRP